MIDVQPLDPVLLQTLRLQKSQAWIAALLHGLAGIDASDPAVMVYHAERPIGALGAIPHWPGRATCWALLAEDLGPLMIPLTRAVKAWLELQPHRRLEATCQAEDPRGHRWAELLGFERECLMRGYGPNGEDYLLYSRVWS